MQANTLKLNNKRKKRKTVGRGGKKGTYSGRGNKGQKARSGASIYPLFEGGRSTLIEHMKKKRGFKSKKAKNIVFNLDQLNKAFKNGDVVDKDTLISSGLVGKMPTGQTFKILGRGKLDKKLEISENILLSQSAKTVIEKAGGKIIKKQETANKKQ